MSAFLDTNVLIRHLTGDPPAQARRTMAFLATADELLVPDLIVAEVVYVLESFYEVERERVAELVRAVIGFPAVVVVDARLLLRALEVSHPSTAASTESPQSSESSQHDRARSGEAHRLGRNQQLVCATPSSVHSLVVERNSSKPRCGRFCFSAQSSGELRQDFDKPPVPTQREPLRLKKFSAS